MQPDVSVFSERIARLRSELSGFCVDALLFFDMKNIRYLTGFTGSDGAFLLGRSRQTLMVDGRYTNQAKREVDALDVFEYKEKVDGIIANVTGNGMKDIGFESTAMNVHTYLKLQERVLGMTFKPLSDAMAGIRTIKDAEEVDCIKKAADIACHAMSDVRDSIKLGVREKDIALELEFRMGRRGAEQMAFPTIVASGPNTSLPHAKPGSRRIEDGDLVMIDFGAVWNGYHSDETWTFAVGHGDDKQKEVYAVVKEAHDRALEAVRPGVSCQAVDHVARSVIESRSLGKYFSHSTGHGVGLDVHEAPRIAVTSEHILKAGMVVTIEPGVYIPNLWGIRIEDMVLVTENGCEVLTNMPKTFTVLN